ncbi:MAG: phosphotransferase [Bifidobacterium sp.]|nr:phosphotransferase [Bifidobacterium sp.]
MKNTTGDPQLDIVGQRWPDVTLEEASRVLSLLLHPLHAQRVLSHSGRPTAAGSMVRTDQGDVFIKRYSRSVREASSVLPYHHFVRHLASRGIATPVFLEFGLDRGHESGHGLDANAVPETCCTEGCVQTQETTLSTSDALYEVCGRAPGEDRYREALSWDPPHSVPEAEALGEFMARMAQASQGFDEAAAAPNFFQDRFGLFAASDFDQAMQSWLAERPLVVRYLHDTRRNLMRDLRMHRRYVERIAQPYSRLPERWTHGDPHISNFLWRGQAPASVIDFGLAHRNTAIFDLVEALERNTIEFVVIMNGDDEAYHGDLATAILRGYARVLPLCAADLELIADMLPVAQSEAALNWIGYYLVGLRPQDAAWCYETSLLAHTAWFERASGQRYRDAIRNATS